MNCCRILSLAVWYWEVKTDSNKSDGTRVWIKTQPLVMEDLGYSLWACYLKMFSLCLIQNQHCFFCLPFFSLMGLTHATTSPMTLFLKQINVVNVNTLAVRICHTCFILLTSSSTTFHFSGSNGHYLTHLHCTAVMLSIESKMTNTAGHDQK